MPGSSALKTYVHKSEASETLDFENDPWHGSGEMSQRASVLTVQA